jgi:hypothetical protein
MSNGRQLGVDGVMTGVDFLQAKQGDHILFAESQPQSGSIGTPLPPALATGAIGDTPVVTDEPEEGLEKPATTWDVSHVKRTRSW